jgi:hypothetical protein
MTRSTGAPPADSPPAEEIEEQAAASAEAEASSDANAAESSTVDEDANQPADLLSVVKSAVEPAPGPAESSAAEGEEGKSEAEAEEGADKAKSEEDAEDDSKLPFHNHPRWKEVVAERNELRPDAERYRNIAGFMEANSLTGEEVADGFDIMAKLKSGDPEQLSAALEWLEPRVNFLREQLGLTLPEDLRDKVEAGLIDEDTAKEVARTRATSTLASERLKARETADSEAEAARQRAATAQAMATAVEGWEQRIRTTDPDYARKAELVETTCRAIVQREGKAPTTPEEAVALADRALAEVNRQFTAALPPPRAVKPTPQGSSTPTVAEPKTLREAIAAAVNR